MELSYHHCTSNPDKLGTNIFVRYIADNARAHDLLEAAFVWAAESISPVLVEQDSKKCHLKWRKYETALPTDDEIFGWFCSGLANIAVVTGGLGQLEVLDFDQAENYLTWCSKAGGLASSYTERTPRGGAHVFFKVDRPLTRNFVEAECFGGSHLVNVWPSVVNGAVYSPVDPLAPIIRAETSVILSLLSERESTREPARPAEPGQLKPVKDDLIGRIKQSLSTLAYAQTLTDLKPSGADGRWYNGRCPFHDDQENSFWVDGQRGLWGCFKPDCTGHRGGDLLNLVALSKNITIQQAVKLLAAELLK